ncbi:hypothetical protein IQ06DRAFT_351993 [Phaeosphaeriaceae sp. SRC1lsM3a]|nr:hypothetical protein IQ06DRAFT_351993 [Stagonospora sp. SRC1lsM3a]
MATQATPSPAAPNLDRYLVIHVATTCDESGVYVTKDSAEVIELGWILLDAKSCEECPCQASQHPYHSTLHLRTLTWIHVRSAGLFGDAKNFADEFWKNSSRWKVTGE